jgi:quinol monooxygenase YgiN
MLAVTVTFQIDPKEIETFMSYMIANARTSREQEVGCQQFDVCRDEAMVFLYELYDDRAAFDIHMESPHYLSFDAAVRHMIVSKVVHLFEEVVR